MSDLKTLKDIKFEFSEINKGVIQANRSIESLTSLISVDDLRAEAIKWAKKAKENYLLNEDGWAEWMAFFNLTEEDLKEQKFDYADVIVE